MEESFGDSLVAAGGGDFGGVSRSMLGTVGGRRFVTGLGLGFDVGLGTGLVAEEEIGRRVLEFGGRRCLRVEFFLALLFFFFDLEA